jgi:hypothetical protein
MPAESFVNRVKLIGATDAVRASTVGALASRNRSRMTALS